MAKKVAYDDYKIESEKLQQLVDGEIQRLEVPDVGGGIAIELKDE